MTHPCEPARARILRGLLPLLAALLLGAAPRQGFVSAMIARALAEEHLVPDPAPEGKRIAKLVVVSRPIFDVDDPLPKWWNDFHRTTAHDVVEGELLFRPGDRWDADRVAESERNLQNYLYVSTARIVACRGDAPDEVVALVVTRDLWSLQVGSDFSLAGSRIETLTLFPTELNLLGRNKTLGVSARLDPATLRLGANYADPRLRGSAHALSADGEVIERRDGGGVEGGILQASLRRPLYRLDDSHGWEMDAYRQNDVYRVFSGGGEASVRMASTGELLRYRYRERLVQASAVVTRSRGRTVKRNLSAGWLTSISRYEFPEFDSPPDSASLAEFRRRILPRSQKAGGLTASWELYRASYLQLEDIDTFAIPEQLRLGPAATLRADLALNALGFTSSYFEPRASGSWVWALGDDYLTVGAGASARREPGVVPGWAWIDDAWSLEVRNVGARMGPLRLHEFAELSRRSRDAENTQVWLGGDTGLRGYPSAYVGGSQFWLGRVELRTAPHVVRTVHLGLAGFVDAGDAFDAGEAPRIHASTGLGLRVGLPQLNRSVLRIDAGFPLENLGGLPPSILSAGFGQEH